MTGGHSHKYIVARYKYPGASRALESGHRSRSTATPTDRQTLTGKTVDMHSHSFTKHTQKVIKIYFNYKLS